MNMPQVNMLQELIDIVDEGVESWLRIAAQSRRSSPSAFTTAAHAARAHKTEADSGGRQFQAPGCGAVFAQPGSRKPRSLKKNQFIDISVSL
jgi:hypothetical protein